MPIFPSPPPPQPSLFCSRSNVTPSCRHIATSTHCLRLALPVCLCNCVLQWDCLLQLCLVPTQILVWMGSLFMPPKVGCKSSLAGFLTNFCATLLLQKGAPPASSLWRNKCCCLAMCHLWDHCCPRQTHPLLAPPTLCLPYNSH